MFTRIRAAWAKAERTIGATEPTQRLRISSEAYSGFSQNAPAADLFKSHLNELQATLEQSRATLLAAGTPTG
jgi:hypothetical protein